MNKNMNWFTFEQSGKRVQVRAETLEEAVEKCRDNGFYWNRVSTVQIGSDDSCDYFEEEW